MSKEINNNYHSENKFESIVAYGLKHGGIHLVASKNHGKSRLLFSMARMLRAKARVFIFDGSETWLYGFDRIETFTITERDIFLANKPRTTDEIERYQLANWYLIEYALRNYKDILFRLKTRKPSKRGFFVRTVINYLDRLQRESRATTSDNEASQYIAYFIEEAQDCFNSRSTTRLEAEEFLTVFNEARNQKEAFFTASQRLTDFSKTIRTKQIYCIGKIPEEDKVLGIRRLEKLYNIDFNKLEPRTWFFEGEIFKSPLWKQRGKPYQINKEIKKKWIKALECASQQPKRKHSTLKKVIRFLFPEWFIKKPRTQTTKQDEDEEEKEEEYDSEDLEQDYSFEEDSALLEDEDTLW